jgi:hypothetical protein
MDEGDDVRDDGVNEEGGEEVEDEQQEEEQDYVSLIIVFAEIQKHPDFESLSLQIYQPFRFETFSEERSNINAQKERLESACKELSQAYLDLTTEVGMNDEFAAARGWNEKLRRYVKGGEDYSDPHSGVCRKNDPANNTGFVDLAKAKGVENFQAVREAVSTLSR